MWAAVEFPGVCFSAVNDHRIVEFVNSDFARKGIADCAARAGRPSKS